MWAESAACARSTARGLQTWVTQRGPFQGLHHIGWRACERILPRNAALGSMHSICLDRSDRTCGEVCSVPARRLTPFYPHPHEKTERDLQDSFALHLSLLVGPPAPALCCRVSRFHTYGAKARGNGKRSFLPCLVFR